jgi:arylsulfatase A-like enzyme
VRLSGSSRAPRAAAVLASLAISLLLPTACRRPAKSSAPRRNVILVTFDTMRADFLGCYGNTVTRTPTIDGLASRGARFEWAFAAVPFTPPSIWSLLFSEHVHDYTYSTSLKDHNGARGSVAERFRAAGYLTARVVGSSIVNAANGYARGFDHDRDTWAELSLNNETTLARVLELATQVLATRERERPYFLYVHFYDPHSPWGDAPPAFRAYAAEESRFAQVASQHRIFDRANDFEIARFDNAVQIYAGKDAPLLKKTGDYQKLVIPTYRSEIAWSDDVLRRLLAELARGGLLDDTVIAVSSDHGIGFAEHYQTWGYVFPLFNETLRVPLIVVGPDIKARRISTPVSLVDLGATLLDLAGVGNRHADGTSFKSLLDGGGWEGPVYAEATALTPELRFMIMDDDKNRFAPGVENRHAALVAGRYKIIHMPARKGNKFELFDLANDPRETMDLYSPRNATHRALAERLLRMEVSAHRGASDKMDPATLERLRALGYLK